MFSTFLTFEKNVGRKIMSIEMISITTKNELDHFSCHYPVTIFNFLNLKLL